MLALCLVLITAPHSSIGEPVIPSTPSITGPAPQIPRQQALIAAFYYAWMGYNETSGEWTGGQGTSHWTKADGITKTSPLGYYSSMDDRVLVWQFSEMKRLGISFLIISWWGQTSYVNQAVLHLLDFIDSNNEPIQVAIMIEPYGSVDYAGDMNYISQLYSQYSEHIFKIDGKPLLAFYNPLSPSPDERFTIRKVGHGPSVDWTYWQGMDALDDYGGTWNMTQVSEYIGDPKVSTDGVVAIIPCYDDYAMYLAGSRSHYMRFGLDGFLWQKELAFAKTHAKIIIVTSWNEWSENTAIEGHLSELFD